MTNDPGASPGNGQAAYANGGGDQSNHSVLAPTIRDLLHADIGQLRRGFSTPQARATVRFRTLHRLFEEKNGYKMRISYCPPLTLLCAFVPDDGTPASFLHKSYCREVWRERAWFARLRLMLSFVLWPFVTVAMAIWVTWLNGAAIARRCGKSRLRQIAEQVYLSARHAILPPWYYMFELFDHRKRTQAGEYLHRFETKGFFRLLKRTPKGAMRTPLGDKVKFARWCRDRGIATTPVLLVIEDGEQMSQRTQVEPPLPATDLFVKPAGGRGGFGAQRWRYEGEGRYSDGQGRVLTAAQLLADVGEQSRLGRCIIQPRMMNNPDIVDLSNGALSTVRMMTIENETGGFEPTHAVLRMAVGTNTTVDNFHAGGIAAKVDLTTGELGPATDLGLRPDMGWRETHPNTGARITGRVLPFWRETLDLCVRSHAAFPDRVAIGWDVAILENGPVIIEGNAGPDVDILERICAAPLGNSRFGELLAFHVRRSIHRGCAAVANDKAVEE